MSTSGAKATSEERRDAAQSLIEKLSQLRLVGFRAALEEQFGSLHYGDVSCEDRLGLLLDSELTRRDNTRLIRLIRAGRLPLWATIEDRDLSPGRGLERVK